MLFWIPAFAGMTTYFCNYFGDEPIKESLFATISGASSTISRDFVHLPPIEFWSLRKNSSH
jgi:hypothetical protein